MKPAPITTNLRPGRNSAASAWLVRLLRHMDAHGQGVAVPVDRHDQTTDGPAIDDLSSGYESNLAGAAATLAVGSILALVAVMFFAGGTRGRVPPDATIGVTYAVAAGNDRFVFNGGSDYINGGTSINGVLGVISGNCGSGTK